MNNKTTSKFNYNDVVVLHPVDSKMKIVYNSKGIINGKAMNERGEWSYSVSLELNGETWCFDESELEATGEISDSTNNLTNCTVTVSVNKSGKGKIKEQD